MRTQVFESLRTVFVRHAATLAASLLIGVLPMRVQAANSGLFYDYAAAYIGYAKAVQIGDVNGDGRVDVALTTWNTDDPELDYKLFVFLQQADGSLAAPLVYPINSGWQFPAESLQIGDVNGDGRNDIVVGNHASNIEIFLQQADGTLAPSVVYPTPMSSIIRVGDVNNDGRADVVGLDWSSNNVAVFLQNAGGTLDAPTMYSAPHGGWNDLDLGDVNGDGLTDIVVMSGQTWLPNLVVLTQAATGGFNPPVSYTAVADQLTQGVAIGDVNGDGRNDVVVTYGGNWPQSKIAVLYQNAAGGLDPAVSFESLDVPETVKIADVNGDGRKDIVVLHGGWFEAGVYLQNPDGTLRAEEHYFIPYASHYGKQGLAIADIDSDGKPDIAIADYNSGLVVLFHASSADLVTTASASPNPVPVGSLLTYRVSVANQGPDAAPNAVVRASLPNGSTLVSSSPGCTVSAGTWQCTLAGLDAGAPPAELELVVQPQSAGTLSWSVSATSNAGDPYSPNNTASVTTSVVSSNLAPVANAGADRSVRWNRTGTLDGRGSYDPDGSIVSYQWQQVSGHPVSLSNASAAQASFSIPRTISPLPTALVFSLTVRDNKGAAASDTVMVTVTR